MRSPLIWLLAWALVSLLALAAPVSHSSVYVDGLSTDIEALLSNNKFTHIIVGGGNAGLTLAARLTEDDSVSVLVLEAGPHITNNINVTVPAFATRLWTGGPDWGFLTTPQVNVNNRSLPTLRGKAVGGTTVMNGMHWSRGPAIEYAKGWAALSGSDEWSFQELLPSFKKSENFHHPEPYNLNLTRQFNASAHGTAGPVDISYSPFISPQFEGWIEGLDDEGVDMNDDLTDGENAGISWVAQSVNLERQSRVTSDSAYISPIASTRRNLVVLTSAQVTGIVWAPPIAGRARTATGVRFLIPGGGSSETTFAPASAGVILSAGTIQTPQLLELSGIGDRAILEPLGIDVVVDLAGVGANFQDQNFLGMVYRLKPQYESLSSAPGPALQQALAEYAHGQGLLTQSLPLSAYLPSKAFLNQADYHTATDLLHKKASYLPKSQQDAILAMDAAESPMAEILALNRNGGFVPSAPNASYISAATSFQHPLSRGTVHINTTDPLAKPLIDPNYLAHPADLFFLRKVSQFFRRIGEGAAFRQFVEEEVEPGAAVQTDEEWDEWVRGALRSQNHQLGTAAMLPREDGGVVDSDLLVYGTSNVRVVDMSVMPLQASTHTQAIAYAIAEKAAALILGTQRV